MSLRVVDRQAMAATRRGFPFTSRRVPARIRRHRWCGRRVGLRLCFFPAPSAAAHIVGVHRGALGELSVVVVVRCDLRLGRRPSLWLGKKRSLTQAHRPS